MIPLEQVREQNLGCHACSLRRGEITPVPGCGPANARLMIVGEWPGEDEDLLGRPFEDRGGLLLRKALRAADIVPEKVFFAYLVRCRPPNRKQAETQISTCKSWLWQEMTTIHPRVVVTLGKTPTTLLLGLSASTRLSDYVGRFIDLKYLNRSVVAPWYSPEFMTQCGRKTERKTIEFFRDVKERCERD